MKQQQQLILKSRSQQHSVQNTQSVCKPILRNPQSSKKVQAPSNIQNYSSQKTQNTQVDTSTTSIKPLLLNETSNQSSITQRKEMLEKFIYGSNSQLFTNDQIDFKAFIRCNYQIFNMLIEKFLTLNSEIDSLLLKIALKEQQTYLRIKTEDKENHTPDSLTITTLENKIKEKEASNLELQNQLNLLKNSANQKDFLQEYQECCKNLQVLREQNGKLCAQINKNKQQYDN